MGSIKPQAAGAAGTPSSRAHRPAASTAGGFPLSHHAILALAAPFSRRGYRVDLAASDRDRRLLAFRPVELPALPGIDPPLRCTLRLEQPHREKLRLTRSLETPGGLNATVVAEGDDPQVLLEAVEQVETDRQFHSVGGTVLARSYRIARWVDRPPGRAAGGRAAAMPRLVRAEGRLGGIGLRIAERDNERAFEVRLALEHGGRLEITADLLAVLGGRWRPLRREGEGVWSGSVKPPVREPDRTAGLESLLDAAVAHLTETFARAPADFHRRHRLARWRVAFRRLVPLLVASGTTIGFIALVLLLPKTQLVHMILLQVPVVAIAALSMMDRGYRIELPPMPRPLAQPRWGWNADSVSSR